MKVFMSLRDFPENLKGGVLTIGNFDGVHLGHQALINKLIQVAKQRDQSSNILTFAPHPVKVLHPDRGLRELFPLEDMVDQVKAMGVDHLVIQNFDLEFSRLSPKAFVAQLMETLGPSHLVLGDDFRFGSGRAGGIEDFRELGTNYGFTVEQIGAVVEGKKRISSSLIREKLSNGEVGEVTEYLGRPFELRGKVVPGEQRGRRLGFPTANIDVENEIIPKVGVYVTELVIEGQTFPSVTNVGYRPTFEGPTDTHRLTVEAYVLKGQVDLYDQWVRLVFRVRVRPELKFSSSDELIKQIEQDVQFAEEYFAKNQTLG